LSDRLAITLEYCYFSMANLYQPSTRQIIPLRKHGLLRNNTL
jgi:hypothetical protein